MSRPLISVVMASYQRAHLLARSLIAYENQDFDNNHFELIVIDDHSSDGTHGLVMEWSQRTKIKAMVMTPCPKLTNWRDCGAVLNHGIRASQGEYILLTHPEVMPGKASVRRCVEELTKFEEVRDMKEKDSVRPLYDNYGNFIEGHIVGPPTPIGLYLSCKIYYLSPEDQSRIDTVDWKNDGALAVRGIEGFYSDDKNGNPDYRHEATDKIGNGGLKTWESFVFAGHSRETWKRLGGMLESSAWGSVDVAWMERRRTLGIPTITPIDNESICVHQNHDSPGDTLTPRSEEAWKDELRNVDLRSPNKLVYPVVDNLGW